MGEVFAVVSGKGGTGKTTLCAAIGSCMAAEGLRVLCIDADLGLRNLDIALGMTELAAIPFTEVLRGAYAMEEIPEHPKIPGLFLLTAPVTERPEDIEDLPAFLDRVRDAFDCCLIDSPAGIGAGFRLASAHADRILVIAGCDPASLRDAASVSTLLGGKSARLIVNRVIPKRFSQMHTTVDDIIDGTGLQLLGLVPEDATVPLSAARGNALVLCGGKKAAKACLNIARRLRGRTVPLMKL
ncbi:MAG: AAA family ATPase [Oscillospiraceae bacterium]|nr:AAA family ATPase [Oscillospiraceae bacterium]